MKDIYWKGHTILLLISLYAVFRILCTLTAYGNSPIKTVFPIVPSNPFTKIAKVYYG